METNFRGKTVKIVYNSDVREQKYEAQCKALGYEDSDESVSVLEDRFVEFVKERVDENGKKK